jgi:hypothetical protein
MADQLDLSDEVKRHVLEKAYERHGRANRVHSELGMRQHHRQFGIELRADSTAIPL